MLRTAIKGGLTFVTVQTDDLLNVQETLSAAAEMKAVPLPVAGALGMGKALLFTTDQNRMTTALYESCQIMSRQVVFVNCKPTGMAFDAGVLIPPPALVQQKVAEIAGPKGKELLPLLKGMSLKKVDEILRVAEGQFGDLSPKNIRYVRPMLGDSLAGLYPLELTKEYYEPTTELEEWVKTQAQYITTTGVPAFMVPRGIMLAGKPGVGKTMGAKYIALSMGLPLYRFDIATTLNKYLGESESRVAASLQQLDKEEPCVVLMDEVEKVFNRSEKDNAVIDRLLSQVLWWLQDHTSRVLVVMTTNDLQAIPPELYREGRVDMVLELPLLSQQQATALSHRLLGEMLGMAPPLKHVHALTTVFKVLGTTKSQFSHAEVRKVVVEQIKKNKWITP